MAYDDRPDKPYDRLSFEVDATDEGMVRIHGTSLESEDEESEVLIFQTPGQARTFAAALLTYALEAERKNPLGAFLDEHEGDEDERTP